LWGEAPGWVGTPRPISRDGWAGAPGCLKMKILNDFGHLVDGMREPDVSHPENR